MGSKTRINSILIVVTLCIFTIFFVGCGGDDSDPNGECGKYSADGSIHIPSDYADIYDAMNCAVDGDTIIVDSQSIELKGSTYYNDQLLQIRQNNLTIKSRAGQSLHTIEPGIDRDGITVFGNNFTISGLTLQNFKISTALILRGGASVDNCNFEYCSGGISMHSSNVSDSRFYRNGFDISVRDNNNSIMHCDFSQAENLSLSVIGSVDIIDSTFSDVGDSFMPGGEAIYINTGSAYIANCMIERNVYGIYTSSATNVVIEDTTISENDMGVYDSYSSQISINNSEIKDNEEYGIFLNIGSMIISQSKILNHYNRAAIKINRGSADIINSIIYQNTNISNGDSAIEVEIGDGDLVRILNSTIADNSSTGSTGGLNISYYHSNADVTIANSTFWNNIPAEINSVRQIDPVFCLIEGGYPTGISIINSDPLFVGSANYHLLAGSPCIDSGSNLNPDVSDDIDGDIRPKGLAYDIGADEYVF